jgi:hypothetical protein
VISGLGLIHLDGKRLEASCPKLRRGAGGSGWNHRHGVWYYQLELPPTVTGKRRKPLRRGGFATQEEAEAELGCARELLALADAADTVLRSTIAELIVATVRETRALPQVEVVRRKVRTGQDLGGSITVGEWLADFLVRKRKIEESTRRAYASHIRLYLQPYLGHIRLDRLRVAHIAGMYEAIEEVNDTIRHARASGDPGERAAVRGRRPVSPATMHRIRATLRHALNLAIKQERLIDFNPAAGSQANLQVKAPAEFPSVTGLRPGLRCPSPRRVTVKTAAATSEVAAE